MKLKDINKCDIYIALWLFYNMQSMILGGTGARIATLALLVALVWSLYHVYFMMSRFRLNKYYKSLIVLLALFTIYGLILIISGKTIRFMHSGNIYSNPNFLKKIYISLLPIFSFYVFTRKGLLSGKRMMIWTPIFLASAIAMFIHRQNMMALAVGDEDFEFTNNNGYLILSVFPMLPFLKHKPFLQYALLAISIVFIILGIKRGAIVIGVLCTIWFLYENLKTMKGNKKTWVFLLSLTILIVGTISVYKMLATSDYFNLRLQQTLEGDSSGRDVLYGVFWRHFIHESNPLVLLFGNGANATLTIYSNFAHNDWLEIAINQGIVGVVIYLVYWVNLFKVWRQSKCQRDIFIAIGLFICIFFIETLISMSYNDLPIYSTVCLGYCMCKIDQRSTNVIY